MELNDRDFKQLFFKSMPVSWREKFEDIKEPNSVPIEEIEAFMEHLDVRESLKDKKQVTNNKSHGNDNSRRENGNGHGGRGRGCGRGNGRGRGKGNGRGKGRGGRGNNNGNNNGGGKIKASDPCPLPTHSGHTWGDCFQNVANTNNNHRSGGGSGGGGGNNNRNNNRGGSGGNAHVNEDNNNNNDHSSRLSNSGRSSRQSNNNNNSNQDDGHYVTMDSTDIHLNDMFHVDDDISDEYYNQSLSRFSVDLADNFEHYAIGEAIQCQEIIAPI